MPAGKTLALVGGELTLNGTRVNAPNGRIELHAVTGTGAVAMRGAAPPGSRAAPLGAITLTASQLVDGAAVAAAVAVVAAAVGVAAAAALRPRPDVLVTGGQFAHALGRAHRDEHERRERRERRRAHRRRPTAQLAGGSQIRTGTSGANRGGRVVAECLDAA